jgi:hypothetical protein
MVETIKGKGRLESIREPGEVREVEYHFDITTTVQRKSGVAVAAVITKRDSNGWARSLDGSPIPQGEYTLYAEDGEILRVDYFDVWAIVPSP